jgi:hypothetical protein
MNHPFDKLAEEIIEMIIECLTKDVRRSFKDLSKFSLCNRRLRRIALPLLFREIYADSQRLVFNFLGHLVEFPHLAPRVRTISLECTQRRLLDTRGCFNLNLAKATQVAQDLRLPANVIFYMQGGAAWAAALCILALLPNLEVFHLDPWVCDGEFDLCCAEFFRPRFFGANITHISLSGNNPADPGGDLNILLLLFLLPSVKKVNAFQMRSTPYDHFPLISASMDNFSKSNVEVFRLSQSTVSKSAIGALFRLTKNLKTFTYIESIKLPENNLESLEALQQTLHHVSNTLEVLKLSLSDSVPPHSSPWSFYNFKALKTLHVCGWRLWGSISPEEIVGYLPPSLETLVSRILRFLPSKRKTHLEHFRVILREKSPTVLPRLKTISCDYRDQDWTSISDLGLEKGVEIVPYEYDRTYEEWTY